MNPGISRTDYPQGLEKSTISLCLRALLFHQCSCCFCWKEGKKETQRRREQILISCYPYNQKGKKYVTKGTLPNMPACSMGSSMENSHMRITHPWAGFMSIASHQEPVKLLPFERYITCPPNIFPVHWRGSGGDEDYSRHLVGCCSVCGAR